MFKYNADASRVMKPEMMVSVFHVHKQMKCQLNTNHLQLKLVMFYSLPNMSYKLGIVFSFVNRLQRIFKVSIWKTGRLFVL